MQHNLDITRMLINDILDDEVYQYAGHRYQREKPNYGQYSPVWPACPRQVGA